MHLSVHKFPYSRNINLCYSAALHSSFKARLTNQNHCHLTIAFPAHPKFHFTKPPLTINIPEQEIMTTTSDTAESMTATSTPTKDETQGSSSNLNSSRSMRLGKRDSQKKSLYNRARMSFVRSGGQRGATMETLRGTSGADFEGRADIERGHVADVGCGCFGGRSKSDSNVHLLIKGPFCFVYANENAKSPKYAISLAHTKARIQESSSGKHPVWLETNLGDVEYEIVFSSADTAQAFETAALSQAAAGEADVVRKRLGHEHLLKKRASVRYAESIATKKIDEQPEGPVSAEELMANVPVSVM